MLASQYGAFPPSLLLLRAALRWVSSDCAELLETPSTELIRNNSTFACSIRRQSEPVAELVCGGSALEKSYAIRN
jgi:hypothetical protein